MTPCSTSSPDVATVATGLAASMGQHLLSAGAKGKRYLTPHARVLMHQPSGGAGGSATDIRINADLIIKMKQELAEITAANTGHTVEEISRRLRPRPLVLRRGGPRVRIRRPHRALQPGDRPAERRELT